MNLYRFDLSFSRVYNKGNDESHDNLFFFENFNSIIASEINFERLGSTEFSIIFEILYNVKI